MTDVTTAKGAWCDVCKQASLFGVRRTPHGNYCLLHTLCESCERPTPTQDVSACDTPVCTNVGHSTCFPVLVSYNYYACSACKKRWHLTNPSTMVCGLAACRQPFCTAHKRECLGCNRFIYMLNVRCESGSYHINGACSEWCLDKIIACASSGVPIHVPLTPAAQAFIPPYFMMAVALAELNWPVLVTLAVLDLCVPPILLRTTSMHQRWELLKAINRAWRAKNDCAVIVPAVKVQRLEE